jgi:hypothetical protein
MGQSRATNPSTTQTPNVSGNNMTTKKKKTTGVKKVKKTRNKLPTKQKTKKRTVRKQINVVLGDDRNPSKVKNDFWIYAYRQKGTYPNSNANSGKWLIFVSLDNVDALWSKIKMATENGLLGSSSKTATAKENPNAPNKNTKVICVFTYDHTNKDDVTRIREELRKLGIENNIPYKTDNATRQQRYQVKGDTGISTYNE